MSTRLILGALTLSASTFAQVAHAQSAAKPMLATHTVQHETETGSWRAGDAIVWLRVAPTGAIAVYASHGYRSAFAHAIIITPEDADKWAAFGEHMLVGQWPLGGGATMLADSDLALEPTRDGDSTVLAVRLGGVRPDGITFLLNGQSLREVTPILRATAKTAREAQAANAAPPTPAPTPAPAATAPAAPAAAAPAAPAAATPAAPAAPTPTPPAAPHTAAIDSPPPAPTTVAVAPLAAVAPPEVATPDTPAPQPEAEVAPLTPAATTAAVITPTPVITPAPIVATTTSVALVHTVTPQKIAKVTRTKPTAPATVSPSLRRTSAGSIAKPASADETDPTKLAASTVANLVKQWQPQLNLCYTENGLKVNPALTGSIAVRLEIRPTGDVAVATFTRHNWSGAGGKEAESCMRARVMAWMFPPASSPSAHDFTLAFAP